MMNKEKDSIRVSSPTLREYLSNYVRKKSKLKYGKIKQKKKQPDENMEMKLNQFHHFLMIKIKDQSLLYLVDLKMKELLQIFCEIKQTLTMSEKKVKVSQVSHEQLRQEDQTKELLPPNLVSKFSLATSYGGDYFQSNNLSTNKNGFIEIQSQFRTSKKQKNIFKASITPSKDDKKNKDLLGFTEANINKILSQQIIQSAQESSLESEKIFKEKNGSKIRQ